MKTLLIWQNDQWWKGKSKERDEYMAFRSSVCSFSRNAHSSAFSAQLARSLTLFGAHGKEVSVSGLNSSISSIFQTTVHRYLFFFRGWFITNGLMVRLKNFRTHKTTCSHQPRSGCLFWASAVIISILKSSKGPPFLFLSSCNSQEVDRKYKEIITKGKKSLLHERKCTKTDLIKCMFFTDKSLLVIWRDFAVAWLKRVQ